MKSLILRILTITILAMAGLPVLGQNIDMVRTDVDSSRSSFVTATYPFGVDVVLEDVENCNGVAFELLFNATGDIKYSEWHGGTFGNGSKSVVIPEIDEGSGVGKITVMVVSGESVDTAGIDNPVVIHLDFVVSQSAPHGSQVTFTFVNPHAVVNQDSAGQVIELNQEPIVYNIHGFIDIWPGDTNNDGVVNHLDEDNIALYYGWGAATKNMRSFKRPSASTLWTSQRVLAWDSSTVSYADCDGNGDITAADLLVLYYNHKKTRVSGLLPTENIEYRPELSPKLIKSNSMSIPVMVEADREYIGASARISWPDLPEGAKVIGIERGDLIAAETGSFFKYIDDEASYADIVTGSYDKNVKCPEKGIMAHLVVEGLSSPWLPQVSDITGITTGGSFFELSRLIGVEDDEQASPGQLIYRSEGVEIRNVGAQNDILIYIYNYSGVRIGSVRGVKLSPDGRRNDLFIPYNSFPGRGVYFLQLWGGKQQKAIPIYIGN